MELSQSCVWLVYYYSETKLPVLETLSCKLFTYSWMHPNKQMKQSASHHIDDLKPIIKSFWLLGLVEVGHIK